MDSNPSLRIHVEEDSAREERVQQQLAASLPEAAALAQQFEVTTGWVLNYRPATLPAEPLSEAGYPVFGRFQIADLSAQWPAGKPAVSRAECERLLTHLNRLVARIELGAVQQYQTQTTLIEPTENSPLLPTNASDKVANLLRFAKTELHALGAAVYLLDEATTHLRLRSMIAPVAYAPDVAAVRALENSLADLEALIGNRVNVQSVEMGETWRIPQPFRYGWCLMLGTKSLPLGTLWLFFSQARTPQPAELALLDGLVNQLQSEISSRDKAQVEDAEAALLQQELILAARSNDARLPAFAPEIDGWKIAGWTYRQGYLSSTFHDWAVTPAGNLSVAVGQVVGPMLTSAMSLNNLRSLISAHRDYRHTSETLSAKLNEQIWCHSPGDEMAALIYVLVDPETHQVDLVNAGDGGVVFHGPQGVQSIDQFFNPLGVDLDSPFEAWSQILEESQTIVLFTQGLRHAISETMPSANDADLLRTILLANPGQPQAILAEIEERFFSSDFQHIAGDLSVIVLSRSSTAPDLHHVAAEVSQSILAELRSDDGDLLAALVDSIERGEDWDQLSDPTSLDHDAADFDQHWSADEFEAPPAADDHEAREGEPDEEIEPDPSAALTPEKSTPAASRQPKARSRNTASNKGHSKSKIRSHSQSKPRQKAKPKAKSLARPPKPRRSAQPPLPTETPSTSQPIRKSQSAAKTQTGAKAQSAAKSKPTAKPKPTTNSKPKTKTKPAAKSKRAAQPRSAAQAKAERGVASEKVAPLEPVNRRSQVKTRAEIALKTATKAKPGGKNTAVATASGKTPVKAPATRAAEAKSSPAPRPTQPGKARPTKRRKPDFQ